MSEPRWLDGQEREAWLSLAALMFVLPAALDSQLQRDEDLSMADYMVLAMLSETGDRQMRMSDLAALASTSQSRLSRIVSRLEQKGFVSRTMAAEDRRAVVAHLTDHGMAKVEQAAPGHVEAVRSMVFDRLTDEQVGQLAEIGRALLTDACTPHRALPADGHPQGTACP
ncbi:MarR family transcriptional regulator [Arthrobacter sp. I2-34]|uniref:MarR family transcriptional regulator n=1 Tax=Arthrobacter hankyongi TaxID=2904801 RepID=A0ABS9LAH6_9MICC|nr:MarR family transcriptional regulator [Arthrobacter hankyongi]MCG2623645.1 MarR family transcriptional regulator [Arthrobacter hankyongi]